MAKFLKFFDNNKQRSTYELGEDYITPYVSAIKGTNGGGVSPRYNLPSDILCVLTLQENSTVYITGENTFNMEDTYPYHEDIVSAIITNRCTSIGENAFNECTHLSSVTIPDSVTTIGNSAFTSCSSLTHIVIPQSVSSIGNSVFLYCNSLSSVTLSNNITKLETATFQQCISLEYITLPNTLKELEYYAFYGSGLKELIIPEGVTKIEGGVISSCPNLESVTFHSSIEDLTDYEFLTNCNKLREIKIIGTKDMTNIITFNIYNIGNKSDLTLYVDSYLVDAYKAKRDRFNGLYKILPLQQ
jgi:surface antigen bspA-like